MLNRVVIVLSLTLLFHVSGASAARGAIIPLNYGQHWTVWYNCNKRGYEAFYYKTVPDAGNLERYEPFHHEKRIPRRCRQTSTWSYKLPKDSPIKYDRGHGVHQNIWDHDQRLMKFSNSMANIVPQASKLNRWGAWRQTEKLTECYRDLGEVSVWGGVIWGTDASNDHFLESHGVVTPDYLWKVIIFPNGEVNAWLFPNNDSPAADKLDKYLIQPAELGKKAGFNFDIPYEQRYDTDTQSEPMPSNCDWS